LNVTRLLTAACIALCCVALVACGSESRTLPPANVTPILLFNGTGASPGDVAAVENILTTERLSYSTVDSPHLNQMPDSQLREYRLLIVPGGNFIHLGRGLTPTAAANIRNAVQQGMNYFGICAGAFFAGSSPFNGLNLTSGVRFGFYSAEDRGVRKAPVPITTADGQTLDQYWEDGPQLTGWGAVVGKFPDGTPAIAEGSFGNGWVVLSGVHPEAPASWRRGMDFRTPTAADHAYAAALIRAALNRESLPHY